MKFQTEGKVIKGLGGLFVVRYLTEQGTPDTLSVRAKGVLRRADEKVLVGDLVTVSGDDAVPDDAVISCIHPRKNALIRPPLANIDLLFVVFSAKSPVPVTETIDKLIAICEYNHIEPVIVVTKADLDGGAAEEYADIYRAAGFSVFVTSAVGDEGVGTLGAFIDLHVTEGRTAAFAGASGVGKTSLVNRLFPTLSLPTAHISRKIERGRHTTRHVELYSLAQDAPDCGFLADTPGFSLLDFERFDFFGVDDVADTFRELAPYVGACRYADCAHCGEGVDECAVARAAEAGLIPRSRLASYRSIYTVLKNKNAYDA